MRGYIQLLVLLVLMLPTAVTAYEEREDTTIYLAVYNHEWQYSIWPADRELPLGWQSAEFSGHKPEVLDFIERVWTDMRPRSLQGKMHPTNSCILANLPPHKCQP